MNTELTPGVSLSGVRLGASIDETRALLGEPVEERLKGERATVLHYPSLEVFFVDGVATELTAVEPPVHRTPEGITVGMPWADLKRAVPDIVFDEHVGSWWSPSKPGVSYDVARPAYEIEKPHGPPFVAEMYEVRDERAFVRILSVVPPKYGPTYPEILPGVSVSGVRLGASIEETRAVLGEDAGEFAQKDGSTEVLYPSLHIMFRGGVVTKLIASDPPIHRTPEGVKVDTIKSELTELLPDIVYDEDERLWYSPSRPGVWYAVHPPVLGWGDEPAVTDIYVMRPKDER